MQSIKYASAMESNKIVQDNPMIIAALAKHFVTIDAAINAVLTSSVYPKFFQDANCQVPLPGPVFSALKLHFECKGPTVNDQKQEIQDAAEFETFVGEEQGQGVHYKVSRQTKKIHVEPADTISKMVGPTEALRPGFTRFVGQLVSLYDFSGPTVTLWSSSGGYDAVQPLPYPYLAVAGFIVANKDKLHVPPPKETSPLNVIRAVIDRVSRMPLEEYLELSTSFYMQMMEWGDCPQLRQQYPLDQIGKTTIDGAPFFKHPQAKGLRRERLSFYLYQNGPWGVKARPPTELKVAVEGLQKSRSHRRENNKGYSGATVGHEEGGQLSPLRVEVTRTLGLILPLLEKGKKIQLKTTTTEVAQNVHAQLVKEYPSYVGLIKYLMTAAEAVKVFTLSDFKEHAIEQRTPDVMFVNMLGIPLPTAAKSEDLEKVWKAYLVAVLPEPPYTVYTKVCTGIPETYKVFKFGSSHAFDFIISTEEVVEVAGKVVVRDSQKLKAETRSLQRITNSKELLVEQFRDDRRKLEMYASVLRYARTPSYLNLWTLPEKFSKKAMKRVLIDVTVHGDTPVKMLSFEYDQDDPVQVPPVGVQNPVVEKKIEGEVKMEDFSLL